MVAKNRKMHDAIVNHHGNVWKLFSTTRTSTLCKISLIVHRAAVIELTNDAISFSISFHFLYSGKGYFVHIHVVSTECKERMYYITKNERDWWMTFSLISTLFETWACKLQHTWTYFSSTQFPNQSTTVSHYLLADKLLLGQKLYDQNSWKKNRGNICNY